MIEFLEFTRLEVDDEKKLHAEWDEEAISLYIINDDDDGWQCGLFDLTDGEAETLMKWLQLVLAERRK